MILRVPPTFDKRPGVVRLGHLESKGLRCYHGSIEIVVGMKINACILPTTTFV